MEPGNKATIPFQNQHRYLSYIYGVSGKADMVECGHRCEQGWELGCRHRWGHDLGCTGWH